MTPSIHLRLTRKDFESWLRYLETLKYRLSITEADFGSSRKVDYFFYEPSGELSLNVAGSKWVTQDSKGRNRTAYYMTVRLPAVTGPSKYSTQSGSLVFDPEATRL